LNFAVSLRILWAFSEPAIPKEEPASFWVVAEYPTPLTNSPDFRGIFGGKDGNTVRLDKSGLIREMETILFPGSALEVHGIYSFPECQIFRVTTSEYPFPSKNGYFVDSRFVKKVDGKPPPRKKFLPSPALFSCRLKSAVGAVYIWGGNWRFGIPKMLEWFPPKCRKIGWEFKLWTLRGTDCSGLIYQASKGFTPRNASALVSFGKPIPISGLDADAIANRLEPFDLIVWHSHVVIVLDREHVIQSRPDHDVVTDRNPGGVRIDPLRKYLRELLKERTPVDFYSDKAPGKGNKFVVRRWYPRAWELEKIRHLNGGCHENQKR